MTARAEIGRQSIGMFGGTFDPVHVGHLILAERAREELGLDLLLFVPAFIPPHKITGRKIASAESRADMLRLAIAGNPGFRVENREIERQGISYTVETIRTLREAYPDARFTLLIGADNARDFRTWHQPEAIAQLADVAVWARPGISLSDELLPGIPLQQISSPLFEISSTDIRERLAAGRSIRYLVPDPVLQYIDRHGLYR